MTVSAFHQALVHIMVLVSASDSNMTDREFSAAGALTAAMPAFNGFDRDRIIEVAQGCQRILAEPDGLQLVLRAIKESVPPAMVDTAYAIGVEIAVADLAVRPEELRVLQLLRGHLGVSPLSASAIEHAAVVRHRTLR